MPDDFEDFVRAHEPRLRRALVAAYGPEDGRDAAAGALAWAWEHWEKVRGMEAPGGLPVQGRSEQQSASKGAAPRSARWGALAGVLGLWLVRSDDAEEGYVDSVDREVDLTTGWVSIDDPFSGGQLIRLAANDTEAIAIVKGEPEGDCPSEGPCATRLAAWRSLDGITWTPFDELPDAVLGDRGFETYVEGVGWTGDRWLALGARDRLPTYWEIDGEPGVDGGTSIGGYGWLTSLSVIDGQLWFGGTAGEVEPASGPGLWLADAALGSPPRAIELSIPDDSACADGADEISAVVTGGPGLVAVNRGCTPGIWTSADGVEWSYIGFHEQELADGGIGRGEVEDVVAVGGDVVIAGAILETPTLWRLDEAGKIAEIDDLPGRPPEQLLSRGFGILGIERGRHGMVAAGSVDGDETVWVSSDGTTWDLAELGPGSGYAPLRFVAALGDRFIVAPSVAPPPGEGSLRVWIPPGTALDLVERDSEGGRGMQALIGGSLVIEGDCLMIESDADGELISTVWPGGARVTAAADGSLAVADRSGGVAAIGAEVRLGGGEVSRDAVRSMDLTGPADTCLTTDPVWMVSGIARGAAGLME